MLENILQRSAQIVKKVIETLTLWFLFGLSLLGLMMIMGMTFYLLDQFLLVIGCGLFAFFGLTGLLLIPFMSSEYKSESWWWRIAHIMLVGSGTASFLWVLVVSIINGRAQDELDACLHRINQVGQLLQFLVWG